MPGRARETAAVAGRGPEAPGLTTPASGATGRPWARRLAGWAAIGVPGIAVLALDGFDLGTVSLWRDEAYTAEVAVRSFGGIFTLLRHTDAVNSTYYLVMHVAIGMLGTSTAALRVPSLLAMAVTAVVTAVIGRRLARVMSLPAPALTGMAAGLFFAISPEVTRYAQDARGYAIVTMTATIASYLLIRAVYDPRWRWWAAYGVMIALTGMFNLLAVLILAAHGVTLLIVRARRPAASHPGEPPAGRRAAQDQPDVRLWRWLAAGAGAVVVLAPLLMLGYRQRRQVSWLTKPGLSAFFQLADTFSGGRKVLPLVVAVALAGIGASFYATRRCRLDVASLAVPWLVVPPVILVIVSQDHPVYDVRYVTFCLPALALLAGAGLAWLARLAATTPLGRGAALAWLPSALVVAVIGVLLVAPQRTVRGPLSRPDNLRAVSALVAAHERPGDAVFYIPNNRRVDSMAYPAPFRELRDLALARTPVAAGNLLGINVSTAVLRARFAGVRRVWVVSGRSLHLLEYPKTAIEKTEMSLIRHFTLIGRWYAGTSDMLSLYQGT